MRFACVLVIVGLVSAATAAAESPLIHFDLPPLAAAHPTAERSPGGLAPSLEQPNDSSLVTLELKLSSMITSPGAPQIDQWLVQCLPRDKSLSVADYAPRTEVASDIAGPIQIKKTSEKTRSAGASIDGAYGHLARVHTGLDRGNKDVDSYQLDRVAPVQAVTASGTIRRGQGVFFKLRWTAQQVLEGEKTFRLTLRVPPQWRGGLLDVSVIAQSEQKTFAGLDSVTKTLGSAHFVVATYRSDDVQAAQQARELVEAEYALRDLAMQHQPAATNNAFSALIQQVASKLDGSSDKPKVVWIDRLLLARADPHFDKEIRKLPMPVRVAVLDYVDRRDDFLTLGKTQSQHQ